MSESAGDRTSKTVAEQQEEYRARIADGMWPDANVEDRLRLLAEIERLTRELAVQKGINNLAYIPHRALVESRDGLQKRYDKVEAERDRLRAALEWYARAGWMEFANEDDNGRRAREVLSGAGHAVETGSDRLPALVSLALNVVAIEERCSNLARFPEGCGECLYCKATRALRPPEKACEDPTDAEKRAMGVDLDSRDHEAR